METLEEEGKRTFWEERPAVQSLGAGRAQLCSVDAASGHQVICVEGKARLREGQEVTPKDPLCEGQSQPQGSRVPDGAVNHQVSSTP